MDFAVNLGDSLIFIGLLAPEDDRWARYNGLDKEVVSFISLSSLSSMNSLDGVNYYPNNEHY